MLAAVSRVLRSFCRDPAQVDEDTGIADPRVAACARGRGTKGRASERPPQVKRQTEDAKAKESIFHALWYESCQKKPRGAVGMATREFWRRDKQRASSALAAELAARARVFSPSQMGGRPPRNRNPGGAISSWDGRRRLLSVVSPPANWLATVVQSQHSQAETKCE
jgi:hypothetical protein